eukprot:15155146-Ditylum_brightwellii.AAC.1
MQFGQVELSNSYLIKFFTREQDGRHKTSNDGQKMQNDQTKQAIIEENITINQIRRTDNEQEGRRKKEKKSISKVDIRYRGRK